MGESQGKVAKREEMLLSCAGVQTVAGRVQVRWAADSSATPTGQLAYLIEFLNLTGLWASWVESAPLCYANPNAPSKADVLGTWMLSILAAQRRYAHVTAMRCDGVNPGLLGMDKVVSEDALRNALKRIPEAQGTAWLDGQLTDSVAPLLDAPWILDTDTTIKPLYGHQEGAVLGYKPRNPGGPSHAYHTYLMAGLRQVLGADVHPGNEHSAKHARPGLLEILDELKNQWGWDGLTTHDLHRCQLAARAVALIYNWWSLFVRLAPPQARREAITARPWLMAAIGRRTEHAGQTTITLTGLHAHFDQARAALMRGSALLQGWAAQAAEQLNPPTVWHRLCDHLRHVLAGIGPLKTLRLLANHADGIG